LRNKVKFAAGKKKEEDPNGRKEKRKKRLAGKNLLDNSSSGHRRKGDRKKRKGNPESNQPKIGEGREWGTGVVLESSWESDGGVTTLDVWSGGGGEPYSTGCGGKRLTVTDRKCHSIRKKKEPDPGKGESGEESIKVSKTTENKYQNERVGVERGPPISTWGGGKNAGRFRERRRYLK